MPPSDSSPTGRVALARARRRRRRTRLLVAAGALGAVVVLTGAVALAAIVTQGDESGTDGKKGATPAPSVTASAAPASASPSATVSPSVTPPPATEPARPRASRSPAPLRPAAPVLVLNNSTVQGLAARSADRVRNVGFAVSGIGNLYGQHARTTVYYRPGYAAQANLLAGSLRGLQAVTPAPGWLPGRTALTLVVTSDFGN